MRYPPLLASSLLTVCNQDNAPRTTLKRARSEEKQSEVGVGGDNETGNTGGELSEEAKKALAVQATMSAWQSTRHAVQLKDANSEQRFAIVVLFERESRGKK